MKYNIRGDKIEVTDSIRDYIESKLGKLDKYFKDDTIIANVLIRVKGREQVVEVTIPTSKFVLRNEERQSDLYASIDKISDKLERQIRKNKTKLSHKNMGKFTKEFNFDYEYKPEEEEELVVVKRKSLEMKPMSEEEAILQMNLLDHEFFVYKDSTTNKICVLYKRKDGNYGIIETK